jgi:NAD(P)-dependent dehydrogenase (short-subunit alcohol dehydrogenase family)
MGIIKYQKYLDSHIGDLSNKTVVITGANSGIGFYAARLLAFKGASIIMACRNLGRAEEARKAIIEAIPHARIEILIYDQASLASIEQFAGELTAKYPLINGFVFNAGIFHPQKDAVTKDGYPLTIGTNYLGTFYLSELLRPYFAKMEDINVVCVGSLANRRYKCQEIATYFTSKKTTLYRQYALSKKFMMANHYFFMKQKDTNIHYSMMHPGVASTNIVSGTSNSFPRWFSRIARGFMSAFMNHPEKAALGIAILAVQEKMHGCYLLPRGLFEISGYPRFKIVPQKLANNAEIIHEKTLAFFRELGKL